MMIILSLFNIWLTTISTCFFLFNNEPIAINNSSVIKWNIEKTSTLKILGSSNVHDFKCDVIGYASSDTIIFNEFINNVKHIPLKGAIKIDINTIDCHNFIITRNFRNTLKSKEFPFLVVKFLSLDHLPNFASNKDHIQGVVEIELGGVAKKFEILYKIQKNGKFLILNGQRNFIFSDFELQAPTILGGLVRIYNNFNVEFNLNLIQNI